MLVHHGGAPREINHEGLHVRELHPNSGQGSFTTPACLHTRGLAVQPVPCSRWQCESALGHVETSVVAGLGRHGQDSSRLDLQQNFTKATCLGPRIHRLPISTPINHSASTSPVAAGSPLIIHHRAPSLTTTGYFSGVPFDEVKLCASWELMRPSCLVVGSHF